MLGLLAWTTMNTRPQKNGVRMQLNRNRTEARANSNMGVIYGIGEQFKILAESNKNSYNG